MSFYFVIGDDVVSVVVVDGVVDVDVDVDVVF